MVGNEILNHIVDNINHNIFLFVNARIIYIDYSSDKQQRNDTLCQSF